MVRANELCVELPCRSATDLVALSRKALGNRFRSNALAQEIETALQARVLKPENIYVSSHRRSFVEYMREYEAGAGETIMRMLEVGSPMAIMTFGAERVLIELLRYSGSAVSCDCGATEPNPGLHPRS